MSVKYCPRCGAGLESGSRFCMECGAPIPLASSADSGLQASRPEPPVTDTAPVGPASGPPPTGKPPGFPWLPVLILLAGVLALAAALVMSRGRRATLPAGEVLGRGEVAPTAVPYEPGLSAEATEVSTVAATPSPTTGAHLAPSAAPGLTPPPAASGVVPPFEPTPTATPTPPPPTATPTPPIVAVFKAREKVKFDVSPEDAHVIINGDDIGKADDWDDMGGGKSWKFPSVPGVYWVRLELEGYRTTWIKIVADSDAKDKTAKVDTELKKAKHDDDEKKDRDEKNDDD